MIDSTDKRRRRDASPRSGYAGTQAADRRHAARYQFTAAAEVIEHSTGARFSTRTTDLGPGGCFVDTLVPFPVGSNIRIALHKGQNTFETDGTVVYAQSGLGMGIAFNDLSLDEALALSDWLGEVTKVREQTFEILRKAQSNAVATSKAQDRAMIARLVNLLVTKGILTEAEGSSVLFDPVL